MAKFVLTDAYFEIDGTDLSDHVQNLTINYSANEVDSTTMGADSMARLAGLKDWSMDVTLAQDFASGETDDTIFSLVGSSAVTVKVRPTTSAASSSNPEFSGSGIVFEYNPIDGAVGDFASVSISIRGADGNALTRSTA